METRRGPFVAVAAPFQCSPPQSVAIVPYGRFIRKIFVLIERFSGLLTSD
jgi:hypothetical protein